MTADAARGGAGRRLWAGAVTLLAVLLPALVAGAGLDAPPRAGELARLAAAEDSGRAPLPRSEPALLYYRATAPSESGGPLMVRLAQARAANVPALFAVSGLLYLSLALARRRTTGLLACAVLAVLPPVLADGHVLRPEVPAAVLGGLAVLLVVGFPVVIAPRRRRSVVQALASMVVTGCVLGLAVATLPTAGIFLLVPGAAFAVALVLGVGEALRLVRRPRWRRGSLAAVRGRALPWLGLALASLVLPTLLQPAFVEGRVTELGATGTSARLLPRPAWLGAVLVALALLGLLRLVGAAARAAMARRRVTPDVVVAVYALALTGRAWLGAPGTDALPAAPAFALLTAEGIATAAILAVGRARAPHE